VRLVVKSSNSGGGLDPVVVALVGDVGRHMFSWMWKYRRGYTGFDYHVTGGHEADAEAAQRAKET
jgi:hypothetical protein